MALRFGDRARREGIDPLLHALQASKQPTLLNSATDALLATGDEKAEAFLVGTLKSEGGPAPSLLLVQRLFARGHVEAVDLLLALLDGTRMGEVFDMWPWTSGNYDRLQTAGEVVHHVARWTDEMEAPGSGAGDQAREASKETCRAWVARTFERIQAGGVAKIELVQPAEPYVAWSGSGRWTRRL